MKNLKYLFLILTIAFTGVACETYDDFDENRIPVVGFTRKNLNINAVGAQGSSKTQEVVVFASDIASSDRTFAVTDIEIDNPEEFTPTDRQNFDYETTVTIPAGERQGVMIVTAINHSLSADRTYFRLKIEEDPAVVSGTPITIGLRK